MGVLLTGKRGRSLAVGGTRILEVAYYARSQDATNNNHNAM